LMFPALAITSVLIERLCVHYSLKSARKHGLLYDEAMVLLNMCDYLRPTLTAAMMRQYLSQVWSWF
jgi:hypothetical protein